MKQEYGWGINKLIHSFCVCTPIMKQTAVFSHLYLSVCEAAKHGALCSGGQTLH